MEEKYEERFCSSSSIVEENDDKVFVEPKRVLGISTQTDVTMTEISYYITTG